MELKELCLWLRANSSGIYRPSAEAADAIERLAWALAMYMDGTKDHDIEGNTGLPGSECQKISSIRSEAAAMVFDA